MAAAAEAIADLRGLRDTLKDLKVGDRIEAKRRSTPE